MAKIVNSSRRRILFPRLLFPNWLLTRDLCSLSVCSFVIWKPGSPILRKCLHVCVGILKSKRAACVWQNRGVWRLGQERSLRAPPISLSSLLQGPSGFMHLDKFCIDVPFPLGVSPKPAILCSALKDVAEEANCYADELLSYLSQYSRQISWDPAYFTEGFLLSSLLALS